VIPALSAAAAVLLVVSGLAKVRAPGPAATMIGELVGPARARWLRRSVRLTTLVRAGGIIEVLVGALLLIRGGRVAGLLLAASYLVFTVVALRLLSRASSTSTVGRTSCGCFGSTDSPIGPAHAVLDLVGLGTGVAATVHPVAHGAGLFDHGPLVSSVACGQVLLLAGLGYLAITALPALGSARRLLRP
jgi:hypothetical protein